VCFWELLCKKINQSQTYDGQDCDESFHLDTNTATAFAKSALAMRGTIGLVATDARTLRLIFAVIAFQLQLLNFPSTSTSVNWVLSY
jgi:hypothetical protein